MFYGANQHQTRYGQISRLSLHAEMNALKHYLSLVCKRSSFRSPKKKNNGGIVYVVRVLRTKENLPETQNCWLGNSRPCDHCRMMLAKYGFKKIKYTDIINGINVLCEMRLHS